MKKRALVLGGLIAAVAITGYSVSGTYAKYTSSTEATGSAVVAKWGFKDGSTTIKLTSLSEGELIAPGYSGSYIYQTSGSGTLGPDANSEVPYKVKSTANVTNTINYIGTTESPIEFAYKQLNEGDTTVTFEDGDWGYTATTLGNAITTSFSTEGTYAIGWRWKEHNTEEYDKKDTALGYAMADVDDANHDEVAAMEVSVKIDTTYEQDTASITNQAN